MFGFLRNQRASGSRSRSRAASPSRRTTPRIYINVPNYGGLWMTRAVPDGVQPTESVEDRHSGRELSGELLIDLPRGSGRRRCRAIRVILRSVAKLYMGQDRGWEEDVLFERTLEIKGAMILEEGPQRFFFTIVVPFALAPYDVHPTGRITANIHAEIEGLSGKPMRNLSPSPHASKANSPAPTPRRGRSPSRQPSVMEDINGSPSTTPPEDHSDDIIPPENNILEKMLVSWSDPVSSTQAPGGPDSEVKWLRGNVSTSRSITLLYNPQPSNGVTNLDERRRGEVEGLGPFEVRYLANVWTVCALMNIQVVFPMPTPKTTVYYLRVVLLQKSAITSPRDDPAVVAPRRESTQFVIWERGVKPPAQRPTKETSAVWRGTEAGGHDAEALNISGTARMPNDETGRPSTIDGIITPIIVTHSLVLEVYYSVYGEDVAGKPLPTVGHGQLRLLKVDKPVIVPSCAFIPENVELPSYETHKFCTEPCVECGTSSVDQLCRNCLTSVPHVRHDHDPKIVGNPHGICQSCEDRFITDDVTGKWADCACGLSLQELEDRMRSVTLTDANEEHMDGHITPPATSKDEERGRRLY